MSERGRVLLVGGIRSGKSREAERRLAHESTVTYVATGAIDTDDAEWTARIDIHRDRRPSSWRTVETLDVATLLRATSANDPPILLDCVNLWLARTMGDAGCWDENNIGNAAPAARLTCATDDLVEAWATTSACVVAVTNEVGMSLVPTTRPGRWFAEELGDLNRRLAETADEVWQITVGIATRLR